MHAERRLIFAVSVLGIISCFLPWGGGNESGQIFRGGDIWWGWICIVLFSISAFLSVSGDRQNPLENDGTQIAIVVAGALSFLLSLVIILLFMIFPWGTAQYGLYITSLLGLALALSPLIKHKTER